MTMITFHISESFLSIKQIIMLLILPILSVCLLASSVEPTDCQHSAAALLFSCTVTLAPSVYKIGYSNVLVLLRQNSGRAAWRGGGDY